MSTKQRWVLYVRWRETGLRETIITTCPAMVLADPSYWVRACLPVPAITVAEGRWK
jgi:hypothetical protein